MKKNFLFLSLFLLIFSNLLLIIPKNNNLFFNKNRDSQICGSTFTDVTTADEFIAAANANENICVVNDIDFSEIPSDQSIENYSGIIDGQFHTLYNHNYVLNYDEHEEGLFDNYLFHYFNGTIKDITFEDFPFIFEYIDGTNSNSEFNLENVIFTDYDIENLYFIIDQSMDKEFGLICKEIINTNARNLSFTNIKFNNNQIYTTIQNDHNYQLYCGFYFSLFSSKIRNSNFYELYFMNIEFLNNIIDTSKVNFDENDESNFDDGITRLGILFTSDGIDVNMEDAFVNSLNFSRNVIVSPGQLKLGFLYGNFQSINEESTFLRIYETNCKFEYNKITYMTKRTQNIFWGTLIGYTKSAISINFDSVVVSQMEGNWLTNVFYDIKTGNLARRQKPEELVGKDETPRKTFYDDTYYVNNTGLGDSSNYLYTTVDNLTLNFWKNVVNFDESTYNAWNLEILFDENLNISENTNDQGEIYGFPLFKTFDYLNTTIDDTGNTYVIDYTYVPSESVTYSAIKSIFNDEYILESGSNSIDTGISTLISIEDFKSYYWVDLQRNNLNETNIIIGDIISHSPKNLYTDIPEIINDIDLSLNNNILYYEPNIYYDDETYGNVIFDDDFSNEIKIIDNNGIETTFSSVNESLVVPSYITKNNINSFYRIELNDNNSLSYITPNKELAKFEPTFSGDLTNTSDDFESISAPYFEYKIDYNLNVEETKTSFMIYLTLIDPNDVLAKNKIDLETNVLTIGSKFAQFDDDLDDNDFETTIKLKDFNILDYENNNTWYYEVELDPIVPIDKLNDYYWIEENDDFYLEYYFDVSGNTLKNNDGLKQDVFNSDLTNTNPIPLYDLNQNFQLEINTIYNQDSNTLFFDLISLGIYEYDIYYDINLILKNKDSSVAFNLNKNDSSYEIKLDPALVYSLEHDSSKTINDYYSLSMDSSKSSYLVFVNEFGQPETLKFNNLSSLDGLNLQKEINETVYLSGDLTNTNPNNLSPFIEPPIIEPPLQSKNKLPPLIVFLILIILFLMFLFSYFIFSTTSYKKYFR